MHVSELVAAKKGCSWCHVSPKNENGLGVVMWQRVGGDDLCATNPFFFSAQ